VSKLDKPLSVPLSDAAIAILKQAKTRRASDLVFSNAGGGKLAHSNFTGAPGRVGIEAGTPHSWRSILRDAGEVKCGFRRETCEAALGHRLGTVEGADRRETAVETRRLLTNAYRGWLTSKSGRRPRQAGRSPTAVFLEAILADRPPAPPELKEITDAEQWRTMTVRFRQ
jgi:hypothetical protein